MLGRQPKLSFYMKKLLFVAIIIAAGLMTGCGITSHLTTNHNVAQTNVDLSQRNYRVIGTATGTAKVAYVFGIGGLSGKAIRANAYADMVKNANLTGAQAIINTTTEEKQRGVTPFYWKKVVTSHGQIIEFIE